jgi:hypothetical protein
VYYSPLCVRVRRQIIEFNLGALAVQKKQQRKNTHAHEQQGTQEQRQENKLTTLPTHISFEVYIFFY